MLRAFVCRTPVRLRLGVAALRAVEQGQVVEARRDVGVVGSQRLLPNRQRALVKPTRRRSGRTARRAHALAARSTSRTRFGLNTVADWWTRAAKIIVVDHEKSLEVFNERDSTAVDCAKLATKKLQLNIPVLSIGGETSIGGPFGVQTKLIASDVTVVVVKRRRPLAHGGTAR